MDSPEIRYCRTEDGVSIAYTTTGSGPPLVRVIGWFTHLEVEWRLPEARLLWERFAQNHLLVRYDGRGMGLSDPVEEFSLATRLADLEAVVEAAGLQRFALLGISEGAQQAIAYAAKHPQRVTQLILYAPGVVPDEDARRAMAKTFKTWLFMIEEGWDKPSATYHDFMPKLFLGSNATPERIRWFTELTQASAPGPRAAKYFRLAAHGPELLDLAKALTVPTLIVQRSGDNLAPVDWSRRLAARIPGARFLLQEGDDHTLVMGGPGAEDFVEAVERFLGTDRDSTGATAPGVPGGFRTILFTDLEGHTGMMSRLGDGCCASTSASRECLNDHQGSEIKTMGDGFMAAFDPRRRRSSALLLAASLLAAKRWTPASRGYAFGAASTRASRFRGR
jgi:pimeloyl-ACP methyl ester carboxylesterase